MASPNWSFTFPNECLKIKLSSHFLIIKVKSNGKRNKTLQNSANYLLSQWSPRRPVVLIIHWGGGLPHSSAQYRVLGSHCRWAVLPRYLVLYRAFQSTHAILLCGHQDKEFYYVQKGTHFLTWRHLSFFGTEIQNFKIPCCKMNTCSCLLLSKTPCWWFCKKFWLNFFNITLPHSCMCVDRVLQIPPWESCDMIIQGSSMWEPLPFGPLKTPSYNKTLNVHRQDGHGFPLVRDNSFCFFMLRCYKSALSLHRFNTFRSMDYLWFSRV